MRVTTDFWVSAYVRRRNDGGRFTAVVRRGSAEAGAVFVKISRLDGTADLFAPLPQAFFGEGETATTGGRIFEQVMVAAPEADVDSRLASERRFDPDCWIVESESRDGGHDLDVRSADDLG
ncbi:hypothetical protein HDIA_1320 [Hartmannibacter diazotrophicus]|uniref:DUF1491 family protein n=1 Tax=Hartmannibacter diazotrophicus TaxID=1482074 RepID=A0A2C9D521_9HYPH|nr:DUF1491 family protein [Hartmannibacter diazotrophicus]SON54861.1 hypothetical protein HDIA_1320 [Hartmannibacter diazotrophicus]